VISPAQFEHVQNIIKFNEGNPLITGKQLRAAQMSLLDGRIYGPYYVRKNIAVKTKTPGIYDLSKLKAEVVKPKKEVPVKAKPATKKGKPVKKEASKGKLGKKTKKAPKTPEPVEATGTVEVPATEVVTA